MVEGPSLVVVSDHLREISRPGMDLDVVNDYGSFQECMIQRILDVAAQLGACRTPEGIDYQRVTQTMGRVFDEVSSWFDRGDFVRFLPCFEAWKSYLIAAIHEWLQEADASWSLYMRLEETRSVRIKPVRRATRLGADL